MNSLAVLRWTRLTSVFCERFGPHVVKRWNSLQRKSTFGGQLYNTRSALIDPDKKQTQQRICHSIHPKIWFPWLNSDLPYDRGYTFWTTGPTTHIFWNYSLWLKLKAKIKYNKISLFLPLFKSNYWSELFQWFSISIILFPDFRIPVPDSRFWDL